VEDQHQEPDPTRAGNFRLTAEATRVSSTTIHGSDTAHGSQAGIAAPPGMD
jgi:hypothetical protein